MEFPGLLGSGMTKLRTTLPLGDQNPFAAVDDRPDQQHQKDEEEEVQPRAIEEESAPSSPILRPMKWRVNVPLQLESSIKKSTKKNKKIKERTEKKMMMMVRSALSQTELWENLEHPNPSRKQNRLKDPLFPGSGLPREITHSRYLVQGREDSINKKIDSSII